MNWLSLVTDVGITDVGLHLWRRGEGDRGDYIVLEYDEKYRRIVAEGARTFSTFEGLQTSSTGTQSQSCKTTCKATSQIECFFQLVAKAFMHHFLQNYINARQLCPQE